MRSGYCVTTWLAKVNKCDASLGEGMVLKHGVCHLSNRSVLAFQFSRRCR
jgi:hypothetical protein